MIIRLNRMALATIALAIAAVLSTSGTASACGTSGKAPSATRGCCARKVTPRCGCCGAPTKPVAVEPSEVERGATLSPHAALSSCECRSSEPAAPTGRPLGLSRVESPDLHVVATPIPIARPATATPVRRFAAPDPGPSRIYLRTSRLLI